MLATNSTLRKPGTHTLCEDLWKKSLAICFKWFPLFQHDHICISKTSCSQASNKWSLPVWMWKARELQHCLVGLIADGNEEQLGQRRKQPHLIFITGLLESYDPHLQLPPRKFSFIHYQFEIILCQKHKQVSFRGMWIHIATFCLGPICALN